MVSPSSRQAETSKKSTSSFLERTLLTAMPKSQTGMPPCVKRSSGSLVRLPAIITLLKLTKVPSSCSLPYPLTLQEHARFSSGGALVRPGDGDLYFLVFYGDVPVPVLVVAEHCGACPP